MKKRKTWSRALEVLSGGAVPAEWALELGDEFERFQPFLRLSANPARNYPCPNRFPCECRHRLEPKRGGGWVAVCDCGECVNATLHLNDEDVLIHEPDLARLCEQVCQALRFEATPPGQLPGSAQCHRVGIHGAAQSPAVLCLATDEAVMLSQLAGLCAAVPEPFILLTPTGAHFTPRVEAVVRRHGSAHIPLSRFLKLTEHGAFDLSQDPAPVLAAFDESLTHRTKEARRAPIADHAQPRRPRYALHKGLHAWTLIFDGAETSLKHEKGILYVAALLHGPPREPIHALDLAAKVPAIYRRQLGITSAVDQTTGKAVALDASARPQERSLSLDDLDAAKRLYKKQQELEAILDDENASEPEKAEALTELDRLYEFQQKHALRTKGNADNLVRAVRLAINRFHKRIAMAADGRGNPHPVLRPFAEYLDKHIITPSARYAGRIGARTRAGVAGRFTHEPPEDVTWVE